MKKISLNTLKTLENSIIESFTAIYQKRTPLNLDTLSKLGELIAIYRCFHDQTKRMTADRNTDFQVTITAILLKLFEANQEAKTEKVTLEKTFRNICFNENYEFEKGFVEKQSLIYISDLTIKRTLPKGKGVPVLFPKGGFFDKRP